MWVCCILCLGYNTATFRHGDNLYLLLAARQFYPLFSPEKGCFRQNYFMLTSHCSGLYIRGRLWSFSTFQVKLLIRKHCKLRSSPLFQGLSNFSRRPCWVLVLSAKNIRRRREPWTLGCQGAVCSLMVWVGRGSLVVYAPV